MPILAEPSNHVSDPSDGSAKSAHSVGVPGTPHSLFLPFRAFHACRLFPSPVHPLPPGILYNDSGWIASGDRMKSERIHHEVHEGHEERPCPVNDNSSFSRGDAEARRTAALNNKSLRARAADGVHRGRAPFRPSAAIFRFPKPHSAGWIVSGKTETTSPRRETADERRCTLITRTIGVDRRASAVVCHYPSIRRARSAHRGSRESAEARRTSQK